MELLFDILDTVLFELTDKVGMPQPVKMVLKILRVLLMFAVSLIVLVSGIICFRYSVLLALCCTALGLFMLFRTVRRTLRGLSGR